MKWVTGMAEAVKGSSDPLSTAAGYVISYLWLEKVQFSTVVAHVSEMTTMQIYDGIFNALVAVGFVIIGHGSFKQVAPTSKENENA